MYNLLETAKKAERLSQDFNFLSRRYPNMIQAFSFPGNSFELVGDTKCFSHLSQRFHGLCFSEQKMALEDLNSWDALELECFTDSVRKALEETF